jgi:hypothetical protein
MLGWAVWQVGKRVAGRGKGGGGACQKRRLSKAVHRRRGGDRGRCCLAEAEPDVSLPV